MSLLKSGACFTAELKKPANKTEIAKTFNDCSGVPHVPDVSIPSCAEMASAINASHQAISISGSTITLSGGGSTPSTATIPAAPVAAPQTLNLSGQNLSISGGNTVVLPTATAPDGSETKVTAGANVTVTGAGTTASPYVVTAAAAASTVFATPAETIAGTSTALAVNPADLVARENIPAQTGLGLVLSAIPAPTASQSPWGVNTLGETLHYAPGVGWQIVSRFYGAQVVQPAGSIPAPVSAWVTAVSLVAPRAGRIVATGHIVVDNFSHNIWAGGLALDGVNKTAYNVLDVGNGGSASASGGGSSPLQTSSGNAVLTWTGDVLAGSVIQIQGFSSLTSGRVRLANLEYTYLN
jgi:hypothetical protein